MQMEHPYSNNNSLAMIDDTTSPPAVLTLAELRRTSSNGLRAEEEDPKPRRPMTSYNVFFKAERQRLLNDKDGEKRLGFAGLARHIAAKWKTLPEDEKVPYEIQSEKDKQRYASEKEEWKKRQLAKKNSNNKALEEDSQGSVGEAHFSSVLQLSQGSNQPLGSLMDQAINIADSFNSPNERKSISQLRQELLSAQGSLSQLRRVDLLEPFDVYASRSGMTQQQPQQPIAHAPSKEYQVLAQTLGDDCVDLLVEGFLPQTEWPY